MKCISNKIVPLLLSMLLLKVISASAQLDPWNAKIMFHSVNGYMDTLWIGCHENGASGYQLGLDIIDTTYVTQGGIWGFDSAISVGECFNLKKDIKNFLSGIQTFNILIADSDFNQTSQYDYISIDTNDFKFNNGIYKITSVYAEVSDGYLLAIDNTDEYFYVGFVPNVQPIFVYDSMSIIFEPDLYDCLQVNDYQMRLGLEIGFNYYPLGTTIEEIQSSDLLTVTNPVRDNLLIKSKFTFNKVQIMGSKGERVYSVPFTGGRNQCEIDMKMCSPGIYYLLLEQEGTPKLLSRKIIIL